MPGLKKMLQSYDHDLIQRIGSFWGVDAAGLDVSLAVDKICQAMQMPGALTDEFDRLPPNVRRAWEDAAANPKKMTWSQFIRKYGVVREFGPAKRDREQPELHPVSTAEFLWYRGLIGRAFMNLPPEPREFVFIPDDLMPPQPAAPEPLLSALRPALPSEFSVVTPATLRIMDHATDWLAAARVKRAFPGTAWQNWGINENFLRAFIDQACPKDANGYREPDAIKTFLSLPRVQVQTEWFHLWLESSEINDLRSMPGLIFEGNWQNDPLKPKAFLTGLLGCLTPGTWYSIPSLVGAIKQHNPDYQRPSGDYDSWYIRRAADQTYLRGIKHWEDVDGALIRHLLRGPLHWLGMIDLGKKSRGEEFTAFRLTRPFLDVLDAKSTKMAEDEKPLAQFGPDLRINLPTETSRLFRYQVGRFCEITDLSADATVYKPTPASLLLAADQGLMISQLTQFLEKSLSHPLPKSWTLLTARWAQHQLEVKVEKKVIVRTKTPEIMQALVNHPRLKKRIVEVLNPTSATIHADAVIEVEKALCEMGILLQNDLDV